MGFSHLFIALLVKLFEDDWASHSAAAWIAVGCVLLLSEWPPGVPFALVRTLI